MSTRFHKQIFLISIKKLLNISIQNLLNISIKNLLNISIKNLNISIKNLPNISLKFDICSNFPKILLQNTLKSYPLQFSKYFLKYFYTFTEITPISENLLNIFLKFVKHVFKFSSKF